MFNANFNSSLAIVGEDFAEDFSKVSYILFHYDLYNNNFIIFDT
jgi:hypothetical protein